MGGKKPAKNVEKLIADHQKPPKKKPIVAKKMSLRGGKPKPKKPPENVLKLITDTLKRKGK